MENIEFLENDFVHVQEWHDTTDQENDTDNSSSFTKDSQASLSSCNKSQSNSPSTALSEITYSALKPYNKQDIYVKRGAKKRRESMVEEAIKTLSNQPLPERNSAEYFGNFVTARL